MIKATWIYGYYKVIHAGSIGTIQMWYPNPDIDLTEDEQYAHNIKADPEFNVIRSF